MGFRSAYGNLYSENGWRMCDANELARINIAGMVLPVRSGWAATALEAWVRWYHENVDRIDEFKPTDDWGWSSTNDVGTSNHLSGTAVDLNATEYPWGGSAMQQRYPSRVAAIRRGLALFEGIIFWGGDWSRRDEMHFQLNGDTANGNGASQKLIDFCNRRIRDGRLIDRAAGLDVAAITGFIPPFLGPVGSDEKDLREQLHGAGGRDLEDGTPGWDQLGGRSPVDAIAAIFGAVGGAL